MHLGILTSHPIQYQAPWFRGLAKEVELDVFFAHQPDANQQGEGFGKSFGWDVDLLSGYRHHFLKNVSSRPSPSRFFGCDTPEIAQIISRSQRSEVRSQKSEARQPTSDLRSPTSGGEAARRFDAFVVCGWHLKCYWQAVRACRRAGIPVLVRGDSQLLTPRSRLKSWIKEIVYRVMLRQFDGFLTVGQRNREYLAHYGVPPGKMFFVPHFVDNEFFRQKAETLKSRNAEIRKGWGIAEDAFCALFCGKFIPKKRPLDLVEAARLLCEPTTDHRPPTSPRLHLLFVGSGELGQQLRANCNVVFDAEDANTKQKADVSGRMSVVGGQNSVLRPPSSISDLPSPTSARPRATFAGFLNQSELPAAYAAADVLVLPSDGGETWGLVVNEAMVCGLPTIVSDAVGCAPDLIKEGKTGFTYPVGDVAALATKLMLVVEMRQGKHDFAPALAAMINAYSIKSAVVGTLAGLKSIQSRLIGP